MKWGCFANWGTVPELPTNQSETKELSDRQGRITCIGSSYTAIRKECRNWPMLGFSRSLKAVGIFAGVLAFFMVITFFSFRHSLLLWAVVFSVLLPVTFWFRAGFKRWCTASLLIALTLAISPIDIVIMRRDKPSLSLLPVSYGDVCHPGTACFGCVVLANPPRKVLVLSYQHSEQETSAVFRELSQSGHFTP